MPRAKRMPMAKRIELSNLIASLHVECVASGTCIVCGYEYLGETSSHSETLTARRLTAEDMHDDGWRVGRVVEDKSASTGPVCPECRKRGF